jgi:hypothetical protein
MVAVDSGRFASAAPDVQYGVYGNWPRIAISAVNRITSMTSTTFEKRLSLSSVPLVRLNEENKPDGFASGALIDYGGKRVLLTVWHATRDQKKWAVQVKYESGKGTLNRVIGSMNFLVKGSLAKRSAKLESVDFSYAIVPPDLVAYRQEIGFPEIIKSEVPITVHAPTLLDVPALGENYGFCGLVLPTREDHFGKTYIERQQRVCHQLSFLRTEGDSHYFSLPIPHPGHEHFKGCSGAPILSEKGAFVGLLCGGDTGADEIRAVSTKACKTPIDILVGHI